MEDDGPWSAFLKFDVGMDVDFEIAEQETTTWIGDDESQACLGMDGDAMGATAEHPTILPTCLWDPISRTRGGKAACA